jgi:histidinol-phosphate aminotransferase
MTIKLSKRQFIQAGSATLGLLASAPSAFAQPPGIKKGGSKRPMARLLANENPYGPSAKAQAAISEAAAEGWKYVYGQERTLKGMIAKREGVDTKNIMIAAGSGEILRIAGLIAGLEDGNVVTAKPTFNMLSSYAKKAGAELREVPLNKTMRHDLNAMTQQVNDKTRMVYLCNPNNPTGTVVDSDKLASMINNLPVSCTAFVDEAYIEFLPNPDASSMKHLVQSGGNAIITRTFSKLHGLAGMRIGYCLAQPDMIKRLESMRMSFLNLAGLNAATASYADLEFQSWSKSKVLEARKMVTDFLDQRKIAYAPPSGNFVFFNTNQDSHAFGSALRKQGVMVSRPFPEYPQWCRVSMGKIEDIQRFIDVAGPVLDKA